MLWQNHTTIFSCPQAPEGRAKFPARNSQDIPVPRGSERLVGSSWQGWQLNQWLIKEWVCSGLQIFISCIEEMLDGGEDDASSFPGRMLGVFGSIEGLLAELKSELAAVHTPLRFGERKAHSTSVWFPSNRQAP